mgnify:CR=1 FL=1
MGTVSQADLAEGIFKMVEADAGKMVIDHLKKGKMTFEQLRQMTAPKPDDPRTRVATTARPGRLAPRLSLRLSPRST